MIALAITLLNEIVGSRYSNFSESESKRSECPRLEEEEKDGEKDSVLAIFY